MTAMADRIMKRIRGKGLGWVHAQALINFGSRGSVDVAISHLAQSGSIRRHSRGLYDYLRQHDKLGALSPDPATIADAIATRSGDKLAPHRCCGGQ